MEMIMDGQKMDMNQLLENIILMKEFMIPVVELI